MHMKFEFNKKNSKKLPNFFKATAIPQEHLSNTLQFFDFSHRLFKSHASPQKKNPKNFYNCSPLCRTTVWATGLPAPSHGLSTTCRQFVLEWNAVRMPYFAKCSPLAGRRRAYAYPRTHAPSQSLPGQYCPWQRASYLINICYNRPGVAEDQTHFSRITERRRIVQAGKKMREPSKKKRTPVPVLTEVSFVYSRELFYAMTRREITFQNQSECHGCSWEMDGIFI